MNEKIGLVVVAGMMSFSSVASAKDAGLELGGRVGYGVPVGKVTAETSDGMNDLISGKIPLQLDVGYRLNPHVLIGGYLQYGIGFMSADECDADGVSCSANVVRLGAQMTYHFAPITVDGGWLGAGIGYEWLNLSVKAGGLSQNLQSRGFEFLNLQGGYDFVVADGFRLGPFALLTVAQYSSATIELPGGGSFSSSEFDKAIHSWLVLGVKGSFGAL